MGLVKALLCRKLLGKPRYRAPQLRRKRKPRYEAGVGELCVLGMQNTKQHNSGGGDEQWGRRRMCEVVVEVKFHRQRPFALEGSSGTMAVQ